MVLKYLRLISVETKYQQGKTVANIENEYVKMK